MDAKSRRKYQMGTHALDFSGAHPDTSPGYTAAVAQLETLLASFRQLTTQQREGVVDVRAAAARKRELKRAMKQVHLAHLARVGRVAAREQHELGKTFVFKPAADSYVAFRGAAGDMATAAQSHREVLVKYGLAESVLEDLVRALEQFDAAVELGISGRTAHVGASAELRTVGNDIVRIVRVMDGLNRHRFKDDPSLLASWLNASTVQRSPRIATAEGSTTPGATTPEGSAPGSTPPPGGEARPAA